MHTKQGDIDKKATSAYLAGGTGKAVGEAAPSASSASASDATVTADAVTRLADTQAGADKKADQDRKTNEESLAVLEKGIKFDDAWMKQKYKKVLCEASLDAFRPALAEYLLAYMRLESSPDMKAEYLSNSDYGDSSLTGIGRATSVKDLKDLISTAEGHADGGVASYTGLHTLTAGERVLPVGQSADSAGGNKSINVGGIHITIGNGDPNMVKQAVLHAMDEVARRH